MARISSKADRVDSFLEHSSRGAAQSAPPWHADVSRLRWLLLGTLGVAAACGAKSEPNPTSAVAGSAGNASAAGAAGTAGAVSQPALSEQALACAAPVEDLSGGWERCANGIVHRATVGECNSTLPRPGALPGYGLTDDAGGRSELLASCLADGTCCRQDSECDAKPHGYCFVDPDATPYLPYEDRTIPSCIYGCVNDSECEPGYVCLCGDPVGVCVSARCKSDADCDGLACTIYTAAPGCPGIEISCQTRADTCLTDLSCEPDHYCSDSFGAMSHRECLGPGCEVGRPFLVDGQQRLAPCVSRDDWYSDRDALNEREVALHERMAARDGAASAPELPSDPALRAAVGQRWLDQALMEHASVAAFARFSLQLMALGAPAALLDASASAMRDEIRHARGCFELGRRYTGRDVGPGALPLDGALDASSLGQVVLTTILEGCIGETVAALEAAEARTQCQDPAASALLAQIEHDEAEHARLAWRFVQWALERAPGSVRASAERTFRTALAAGPDVPERSAFDAELPRHGLVPAAVRMQLRQRALSQVIEPCQHALFASLPLIGTTAQPCAGGLEARA